MKRLPPRCQDCTLLCIDGHGIVLGKVLCRRCYRRELRRAIQSGVHVEQFRRELRAVLNRALEQIGRPRIEDTLW